MSKHQCSECRKWRGPLDRLFGDLWLCWSCAAWWREWERREADREHREWKEKRRAN